MNAKVNVLAKPHPCIFFTQQLDSARKQLGSYLIATYKAHISIQLHMLLDHTLLGHLGGGKWPGDEGKTHAVYFSLY